MKNKLFNILICITICISLCCLVTGCSINEQTTEQLSNKPIDSPSNNEEVNSSSSFYDAEHNNHDEQSTESNIKNDSSVSNELENAHMHKYEKKSIVNPTCIKKGYTIFQCACGDSYKADYKDAYGHNIIVDKAVAATCTKSGLTEGSHCSVCNTVIVAQKQLSAKGHSWSKWTVTKVASVGVKGEEKRTCKTCKGSETRGIAALKEGNYESFKEKIGVYYTDNVKYEYLKNHFDYSAYIQIYTLSKSSTNETNIVKEFENHFGFKPTAKVMVEKVGTYLVDGKLQTVYSYTINDKTYPYVDHPLYKVYHQMCTDKVSHWVGFAIEGGIKDDWGELMSTPKVQALKKEMYKTFYEKTGHSAEYIASHEDDFCMGWISQAGTMRTSDGKLIEVLYIYCREKETKGW